MQMYYQAEVINLSQLNKNIFKRFNIITVRKRFLGFVKVYEIKIAETDVNDAISGIQKNMSTALKKEWYAVVYNAEKSFIIFRKRIFELLNDGISPIYKKRLDTSNAVEKIKWDEMIGYAKSLGIPDNQCDFLPPDFREQPNAGR